MAEPLVLDLERITSSRYWRVFSFDWAGVCIWLMIAGLSKLPIDAEEISNLPGARLLP